MTEAELKKIALHYVDKGYIDREVIRYSDDLYDATPEEIDMCLDFVDDIVENGRANFRIEDETR